MWKWFKSLFEPKKYYCQCEPHVDFTEIQPEIKDRYDPPSKKYQCNKCGFIHQYWLHMGSSMEINPALVNYVYKKALDHLIADRSVDYYVCSVCGYIAERKKPETCPICGVSQSRLKKIE